MKIDEVIKFYGSLYQMNRQTGISRTSPLNWKKRGYIPIETQVRLEKLTEGKLKASLEDCEKHE